MFRPLSLAVAAIMMATSPALAQAGQAPEKPTLQIASQRIRHFLKSVPNLPEDVVVVPATGTVLWPEEDANKNVIAEVWTVVPKGEGELKPIMMFAVLPDTGEVFALYMRSLQKYPTYQ